MKRFILSITLLVLPLLGMTQNHLTFLGVEIDGSMTSFVEKMKEKGFTFDSESDRITTMKGLFTNKSVDLYIVSTPTTKKVYRVAVVYPEKTSWSSIKSEYNDLKNAYKKKYTLDKDYNFFLTPYYEGDGYEMQAVRLDKCKYISFFKTERGDIMIEISKFECIKIVYEDDLNSQLDTQESQKAVQNDI